MGLTGLKAGLKGESLPGGGVFLLEETSSCADQPFARKLMGEHLQLTQLEARFWWKIANRNVDLPVTGAQLPVLVEKWFVM